MCMHTNTPKSVKLHRHVCIYPTPPLRVSNTRSIFKLSKPILNSVFSFQASCLRKVKKNSVCSTKLSIDGGRTGIQAFPKINSMK